MMGKTKKVFVGMSGGVDSSVSAHLLLQQGYDVTGVYLKCWDEASPGAASCAEPGAWQHERRDALRVAAQLGIPFKTYDLTKEYAEFVIEDFFREYENGRTPNPDVLCNRYIKFAAFYDRAVAEGADFIATGHYVQKKRLPLTPWRFGLYAGYDKGKDQSYFLWTLKVEVLRRCLFPVGSYAKEQVRLKADQAQLATAKKKDSQGICFVGPVQVGDFLRTRLPEKPGSIITTSGKIVGEHRGAHFYTVGQRHGLGLGASLPYYVCSIDVGQNIVEVAEGNSDERLYHTVVQAEHPSWVGAEPVVGRTYLARIRYRQSLSKAKLVSVSDKTLLIVFNEPQRAVTSGQSIVLYDGERLLGGAFIKQAVN